MYENEYQGLKRQAGEG